MPVTYLIIINAVGLIFMLLDKLFAISDSWRIPEATLLLVAAIGGSLGSLIGMYLFHHKTRKPLFTFLVPLFLVIHVIILIIL